MSRTLLRHEGCSMGHRNGSTLEKCVRYRRLRELRRTGGPRGEFTPDRLAGSAWDPDARRYLHDGCRRRHRSARAFLRCFWARSYREPEAPDRVRDSRGRREASLYAGGAAA
ncbi:MAG TPA: hypothetical protein VM889_13365 [Candidatus Thermoplasmatota archaeon]|nr:hypothetical protein [Candidatus Thermoplasmatota archaeon]